MRLEQFYPFPALSLTKELGRFKQAQIVWCQEEPKNQGGWTFVEPNLEWVLGRIGAKHGRADLRRPPGRRLARDRPRPRAQGAAGGAGRRGAHPQEGPLDHGRHPRAHARRERHRGHRRHLVQEGRRRRCKVDEMLCELETDKVTVEVPGHRRRRARRDRRQGGRDRRRRRAARHHRREGRGASRRREGRRSRARSRPRQAPARPRRRRRSRRRPTSSRSRSWCPTLGESVTEATVSTWFKKVGDAVDAGRDALRARDRQGLGRGALARQRHARRDLRRRRRHRRRPAASSAASRGGAAAQAGAAAAPRRPAAGAAAAEPRPPRGATSRTRPRRRS